MLRKIRAALGRTPIARLQLLHQKTQTFAAILGITFTTALIFMQIGFRSSYLDTLILLPKSLNADIFIMNASSVTAMKPESFSQRRLYQALGFNEVASITPLYFNPVVVRNPVNPQLFVRRTLVIGFPLKSGIIGLPGVDANLDKLKIKDGVLLDEKSRPELDILTAEVKETGKSFVEIKNAGTGHRLTILGLFKLGVNSNFNATMIASDSTFLNLFNREKGIISLGLIQLKPGVDVDLAVAKMRAYLPLDIKVLSKPELLAEEKDFYEFQTPVGIIFRFGLIASLLVGTVILYQILYIKISKYLVEYATLKAMGFSQISLVGMVIKEAFLLAILGYIPGCLLSFLMYDFLTEATRLDFVMKLDVAIAVLISIFSICFISALLAIEKLREANPADLFR